MGSRLLALITHLNLQCNCRLNRQHLNCPRRCLSTTSCCPKAHERPSRRSESLCDRNVTSAPLLCCAATLNADRYSHCQPRSCGHIDLYLPKKNTSKVSLRVPSLLHLLLLLLVRPRPLGIKGSGINPAVFPPASVSSLHTLHLSSFPLPPLLLLLLLSVFSPYHPSSSQKTPVPLGFHLAPYCPLAQNSQSVFNELCVCGSQPGAVHS